MSDHQRGGGASALQKFAAASSPARVAMNRRAKCSGCRRWCTWRATDKTPLTRHSALFPFLCAECAKLFDGVDS